ncbi:tyrosine recombinase XerC, partial [Paraburkholderia sp. SIMBA_050]
RGFYQWWAPAIGLAGNPVAGVRAPKAPRGLPKALSVEQTQALLDRAPAKVATEPADLRDQAMFELLYSSGLRLSELVGLDLRYTRSPDH